MNDHDRLVRIEKKLDEALLRQEARIVKLETEAGYFRAGFALLISTIMGVVAWAFKK